MNRGVGRTLHSCLSQINAAEVARVEWREGVHSREQASVQNSDAVLHAEKQVHFVIIVQIEQPDANGRDTSRSGLE